MQQANITTDVDNSKLARLLGSRNKRNLSNSIIRKIENLESNFNHLIIPKLIYCIKKTKFSENGGVGLENGLELKSPKLSKAFKNSDELVFFIATIGKRLDNEIKKYMGKNRYSDAYILDAMGSVSVENLVNQFHKTMESKYSSQGKAVTLRFSPGYCDWPIKEQKKLFSLFNADRIGVQLTNSYLMTPRKTISGVFGALSSQNGRIIDSYNPCAECDKKNCIARRV